MKNRPAMMPPDNDIQMSTAHESRFRPATPEVTPPAAPEIPGSAPSVKG